MPSTVLTDAAEVKIAIAAGNGPPVAISHIALGDANGANYAPQYEATTLVNERTRMAIESRSRVEQKAWRVKAEFPPDTDEITVREIGFFDADNTLIALWAGLDVTPRQTGVISYLVDHVLDFSRVADGLMIVDAPDDDLFDHMVLDLEAHSIVADEQVKQRLLIRDLQAAS